MVRYALGYFLPGDICISSVHYINGSSPAEICQYCNDMNLKTWILIIYSSWSSKLNLKQSGLVLWLLLSSYEVYLSIYIFIFMLKFLIAIDFFRCLKLELKREKLIQIFKLVQVSIITLLMFGLSLVSSYTGYGYCVFYS